MGGAQSFEHRFHDAVSHHVGDNQGEHEAGHDPPAIALVVLKNEVDQKQVQRYPKLCLGYPKYNRVQPRCVKLIEPQE